MKFFLLAAALFLAPVVEVQAAPKLKIDARGVALLDREIARVKAFKSFSVKGRETVHRAGQVRNSTFRASLQFPYRAWLQVEADRPIDEGDGGRRRVLMGQKQLFTSVNGAPATTQNIDSLGKRARAFVSVFRGAPSLIFSWMTLSARVNLANHPQTVSVRVAALREGKSVLRNVVVQLKNQKSAAPLERYEFGFDARGRLRRSLARLVADGKPTTLVGHYEPVKSNWKGTQARTDALVYNWNVVAPDAKFRPVVAPKRTIEARAQAILARAQKLYSGTRGLRLQWNYRHQLAKSTEKRELRYRRDGCFFLQGEFGSFHVAAIDGKTALIYDKSLNEYTQKKLRQSGLKNENQEELFLDTGEEEADLRLQFASYDDEGLSVVRGRDALEDIESQVRVTNVLQLLQTTLLAAKPFGGETCDRVRVTVVTLDKSNETQTEQRTLWFARSNGRLMRWQLRTTEEGQESAQVDAQVTKQEFNPTFGAKDFSFSIPKGAKRVSN